MIYALIWLVILLKLVLSHRIPPVECDQTLHDIFDLPSWPLANMTISNEYGKKLYNYLESVGHKNMEPGSFTIGRWFKSDFMLPERQIYYSIGGHKCVNTICEIGFNTGHGTLQWMLSNPNAKIIVFDIWAHDYAASGEKFIRSLPEINSSRLTIYKGPSQQIVPKFHTENPGIIFNQI